MTGSGFTSVVFFLRFIWILSLNSFFQSLTNLGKGMNDWLFLCPISDMLIMKCGFMSIWCSELPFGFWFISGVRLWYYCLISMVVDAFRIFQPINFLVL